MQSRDQRETGEPVDELDVASKTTDPRSGVEVAKGAKPTATAEDPAEKAAPLSLKQRLAAIRDECAGITKDDIQMGNFKIKGHSIEGVLSEIRPLLAKHGVDITPRLVERTYNGNRCDVLVDFTFERTDDSDEQRTLRWAGAGTDNGDKAFAKAGTNALKEMLKKRFLVTDRADAAEAEDSVEHQTDDGVGRADLHKAREEKRAALEQWAKTFKAALETAKDGKDVQRLERENKDQLTDESLPSVTRTFFIELIETRKNALGKGARADD